MNSLIQTPPLLSNYTETRKIKTQKNFTTTKWKHKNKNNTSAPPIQTNQFKNTLYISTLTPQPFPHNASIVHPI